LKGVARPDVFAAVVFDLLVGLVVAKAQLAKLKERYQTGLIDRAAYDSMRGAVVDKL
jgi:hypothetical protein